MTGGSLTGMSEIDRDVAAKRRKDRHGLTTRERQVLTLRAQNPDGMWKDIAGLLGVSKFRVTEIKRSLVAKGMLTDGGQVSEQGKEVV